MVAFGPSTVAHFARTCPKASCHPPGRQLWSALPMPTVPPTVALLAAVERYLDLMFDNDVSRFDEVFAPSAQLHGLRDDQLRLIPAPEYKAALASRPSPKSRNAPRRQEILLVDFASPTQAMV